MLLLQVTAVKVASSGGQNKKVDSLMAKPLKDQAFATPDKVAELVQKVCLCDYLNCLLVYFREYKAIEFFNFE